MKFITALVFSTLSFHTFAQQAAITDTGEEVVLYDDGTWKSVSETVDSQGKFAMNPTEFSTPDSAGFEVKSKINDATFSIDIDKWKFYKAKNNEDAEYEFRLKSGSLYAMAITEEISASGPALADIALENAKAFASDATLEEREYRMVNGNKVIYQEIKGTGNGIEFRYLTYIFSNENGATQLVAYTAENLVEKHKPEIYDFLNGLNTQ